MSYQLYIKALKSPLKKFKCPDCEGVILRARAYRNHQRSVHKLSNKTCPWCKTHSFDRMDYQHLIDCCKSHGLGLDPNEPSTSTRRIMNPIDNDTTPNMTPNDTTPNMTPNNANPIDNDTTPNTTPNDTKNRGFIMFNNVRYIVTQRSETQ